MRMSREELLTLLGEKPRWERITVLRALYKLSQTGLAKIADSSRGAVSTWESPTHWTEGGRGHEPSKIVRQRLGAYFGLPAYVFTDEWGENKQTRTAINKRSYKVPQEEPALRVPRAPGAKRTV